MLAGPPIPSVTDDGWGVSQDPSVSVIRPRIGPLWKAPDATIKKDEKILESFPEPISTTKTPKMKEFGHLLSLNGKTDKREWKKTI